MDNISEQKIAHNEQDDKLVIKFQNQKNDRKTKCKSRRGTIYKLYSPKRFTIQTMEDVSIRQWQSNLQKVFEHALLRYLDFKASDLK